MEDQDLGLYPFYLVFLHRHQRSMKTHHASEVRTAVSHLLDGGSSETIPDSGDPVWIYM